MLLRVRRRQWQSPVRLSRHGLDGVGDGNLHPPSKYSISRCKPFVNRQKDSPSQRSPTGDGRGQNPARGGQAPAEPPASGRRERGTPRRRVRVARERSRIVPVQNGHDAAGERPTTDGQPTTSSRGSLNPPAGADAGGTGGGQRGGTGGPNPAAADTPRGAYQPRRAVVAANKGGAHAAHSYQARQQRRAREPPTKAASHPLGWVGGRTAPCAVPERALRACYFFRFGSRQRRRAILLLDKGDSMSS